MDGCLERRETSNPTALLQDSLVAPPAPSVGAWIMQWAVAITQRLEWALQVRAERRMLAGLDERMLRDIGIDEASAAQESRRALFDLPGRRPKPWTVRSSSTPPAR